MIQSLIFKEWTKTRWVLLLILLVFACVIGYSFMNVLRSLRLAGLDHIWVVMILKSLNFVSLLQYVPLLAGIVLGLAQYVPEMANKRLKLTLHLPLEEGKILASMLLYGVCSLFLLFALAYLSVVIGFTTLFSSEISDWNTSLLQPWLLGGIAAYLLTAWICLEPTWRQRIYNGLIAVTTITLFYFTATSHAYAPFLPWLVLLTVLTFSFAYHSLIRFKDGEQ